MAFLKRKGSSIIAVTILCTLALFSNGFSAQSSGSIGPIVGGWSCINGNANIMANSAAVGFYKTTVTLENVIVQ
jgi:hypothetical protein